MVLAERNGRRSRGPSPTPNSNGQNAGPDSSSDEDCEFIAPKRSCPNVATKPKINFARPHAANKKHGKNNKAKSEYEEKIRVGRDYQVQCPDFIPVPERRDDTVLDRALLVWSPTKDIPETKREFDLARFGFCLYARV